MYGPVLLVACLILLFYTPTAPASHKDEEPASDSADSVLKRETLTGDWFGWGEPLEERGLSVGLGLTQAYQHNFHGGVEPGVGANSGSYDLELEADMERLAGLRGGGAYMVTEGSWAAGAGQDTRAVGSLFGVNDDFGGERTADVTELWYEHHFLDERLQVRLGKIDLTGGFECRGCPVSFDGSLFANDETSQFLNGSLVNNPAIPFPDNGLGAVVFANPVDWWYASVAAADAEADARETGFNTTFDGDSHFFYIAETGVVPEFRSSKGELLGSYRLGVWNERRPKNFLDEARKKRDDTGFYLSADQMLWRENSHDSQGLGTFGRIGLADDEVNEVDLFGSAGLQYRGLFAGRDNDVLGIGYAHGSLSDEAGFDSAQEQVVEVYYNAEVTPWLHVSPDLQWIGDPGGVSGEDAFVAGVRLQMTF